MCLVGVVMCGVFAHLPGHGLQGRDAGGVVTGGGGGLSSTENAAVGPVYCCCLLLSLDVILLYVRMCVCVCLGGGRA